MWPDLEGPGHPVTNRVYVALLSIANNVNKCVSLLLCLEPCKKLSVGGWVGRSTVSLALLLWSKALVLDLDQAEQHPSDLMLFLMET